MTAAPNITYHFTVTRSGVVPDLVTALVAMAIRDLVFGPARRKIETEVRFSSAKPAFSIVGGTECGEHLARLLSGFLLKQVGEDGFFVRRSQSPCLATKGRPG